MLVLDLTYAATTPFPLPHNPSRGGTPAGCLCLLLATLTAGEGACVVAPPTQTRMRVVVALLGATDITNMLWPWTLTDLLFGDYEMTPPTHTRLRGGGRVGPYTACMHAAAG